MNFPDLAHGVAEIARALAWPGVVVFLAVRYRDEVGRLIDRLREGGPAKFDPVPPQTTTPVELAAAGGPQEIQHVRTPAVLSVEESIKALPLLAGKADPGAREAVLVTVAALAALTAIYERTDSMIYASQVELLAYLNGLDGGESLDRVRELFFEPAVKKFPQVYKTYTFDAYLNFLVISTMIDVLNGRASITPRGREYLRWRVESQKLPRTVG